MSTIELLIGLAIVLITLWDAFETLVLPRTVQRRFRLTRLIVRGTWLPWSMLTHLPIGSARRDSILAMYGPLLLIFLLVVWAVTLVTGFGFILLGLAGAGSDSSFGSALYLSGSTFFTLGLGDETPANSISRAVAVIEAGMGFGFLAMVIAYLPIFYQAFSRRETAISLLDARAGSPPTPTQLIRRNGERVAIQLAVWEGWAADLLESHLSFPILAFFRSQHEHQSWLGALTVVLDTSALIMVGLEGMPQEQARFSFAVARHAVVDLTQIFFAEPTPPVPDRLPHERFVELSELLASYGFPLKDGLEAEAKLATLRAAYEPMAFALGRRLLIDLPAWIHVEGAQDDWQSSPWDTMPPI